jgi:hypothetical protein
MKKGPETLIQGAICDYLALKKYFFWRNNTTPIYNKELGCFRAMPKYSKNGVSDIILFKDGKVWFLEVKASNGKLSESQLDFQKGCILNGINYEVVKSIDDVVALKI